MIFMLCRTVKLKVLLSKGVAMSKVVFLLILCLDHYPVVLDLKSFVIRLVKDLKYLSNAS